LQFLVCEMEIANWKKFRQSRLPEFLEKLIKQNFENVLKEIFFDKLVMVVK
jgi:hypothetical protein